MPYTTKNLPAHVTKLPDTMQRQWMHVANNCMKDGGGDGDCIKMANGVVRKAAKQKSVDEPLVNASTEFPELFSSELPVADDVQVDLGEKAYQYVDTWDYEARKMSQADAGYNPVGGTGTQACSNCFFFVSPARCTVVDGEIAPNGKSDQWRAQPTYEPEPLPVVIVGGFDATKEAKPNIVTRVLNALNPKADSVGESFQVYRTKEGKMRWYARYSNKWRDRDKEITREVAHKEYVDWATKLEAYPELWVWHTKGTRFGVADWLDYSEGFAHASGVIDDTQEAAAVVEALAKQKDLGVSHGFVSLQRGDTIEAYRSYEISVLPLKRAAVWTSAFDLTLMGKEATMGFTAEKRKFMVETFGEETTARLEKETLDTANTLKSLGVDFKSTSLEEEEPPKLPSEQQAAATPMAGLKELGGYLADLTSAVKSYGEKVVALEAQVTELKKSDDEKIANAFASKAAQTPGSVVRPSQSDDNVMSREKAAQKPESGDDFFFGQVTKMMGVEVGGAAATGLPGAMAAGAVTLTPTPAGAH